MKRLTFLLLLAGALAGCQSRRPTNSEADAPPRELRVSAAISLQRAFDQLGALYESRTGTKVVFNYGASGVLQKQIENAAPADVFASAGAKQMDALDNKGLLAPATRRDFACNSLILIVPNAARFTLDSFEQLAQPQLLRLAIGNPKTVPAGQYAEQGLINLKLWPQLQSRLVLAEDVRQVFDYVNRGEADAGIVYASDLKGTNHNVREVATAPESAHDPILYPVAIIKDSIKDSQRQAAAQSFVELLISPEGQAILNGQGFQSVDQSVSPK